MSMKIFGAALDPLNSPERLNLKLSYLDFINNNHQKKTLHLSPYDLLRDYLKKETQLISSETWAGQIPVDSWLTPRPEKKDVLLLTPENFTAFLKRNGCIEYMFIVKDYVEKQIFPSKPVMIGVDHSLTG